MAASARASTFPALFGNATPMSRSKKSIIRKLTVRLFPFTILLTMVNFLHCVNIGWGMTITARDSGPVVGQWNKWVSSSVSG